jgi:hypothetical protein
MRFARAGLGLTAAASVTCCLALSPGCGGREGMAPVRGTVTYKGQPLTTGQVQFIPDQPGIIRGAFGMIDESGRYALSTHDAEDGAYVGKYKVTVASRGPDLPIPAKKRGKMMAEDMQGSGKPLIPARYFDQEKSKLSAEVAAGKTNVIDFDLTD